MRIQRSGIYYVDRSNVSNRFKVDGFIGYDGEVYSSNFSRTDDSTCTPTAEAGTAISRHVPPRSLCVAIWLTGKTAKCKK